VPKSAPRDTLVTRPGQKPRKVQRKYAPDSLYRAGGVVEESQTCRRHRDELPALGAAVGFDGEGRVRHLWPEDFLRQLQPAYTLSSGFAGFIVSYGNSEDDVKAGFSREVEVATRGIAMVKIALPEEDLTRAGGRTSSAFRAALNLGRNRPRLQPGSRVFAHGPDSFSLEKADGIEVGRIHAVGEREDEAWVVFGV
jgi:hypothetical protein